MREELNLEGDVPEKLLLRTSTLNTDFGMGIYTCTEISLVGSLWKVSYEERGETSVSYFKSPDAAAQRFNDIINKLIEIEYIPRDTSIPLDCRATGKELLKLLEWGGRSHHLGDEDW